MKLWFLIGGLLGVLFGEFWSALVALLLALILFELFLPQLVIVFPALATIAPYMTGLHYTDVGLALAVFLVQVYRLLPHHEGLSFWPWRWSVIVVLIVVCFSFVPLPDNPKMGVSPGTGSFIVPPQRFPGDFLMGGEIQRRAGWISDDFASDTSLNSNLWTWGTPLMSSIAKHADSKLVAPQIVHTASGVALSGVRGSYEFTGLQSKVSFSTPLGLEIAVNGTKANGNCFELYLVTADLSQYLRVAGNLNEQNGSYYGVWLTSTTRGILLGLSGAQVLYGTPKMAAWYTIRAQVDSRGVGGVSISNRDGVVVASELPTTWDSSSFVNTCAFVVTNLVKLPTTGLVGNSGSHQPQSASGFQFPLLHKPPRSPRISCPRNTAASVRSCG